MKEILSTISSKGQVTLPTEIRRYLGVGTHDQIAFVIHNEGTIEIRAPRYRTVQSLRGAVGSLKEPLSWEETRGIGREDALSQIPERD